MKVGPPFNQQKVRVDKFADRINSARVLQVVYEDEDGKEHRMEIVKVSEKIGNFRRCVPRLSFVGACILCVLNLFLPGFGEFVKTKRIIL